MKSVEAGFPIWSYLTWMGTPLFAMSLAYSGISLIIKAVIIFMLICLWITAVLTLLRFVKKRG